MPMFCETCDCVPLFIILLHLHSPVSIPSLFIVIILSSVKAPEANLRMNGAFNRDLINAILIHENVRPWPGPFGMWHVLVWGITL
jgi:hypothetical protein